MKTHAELTDVEFEKQFEDCSLTPYLFTHEAHLRLAWIHLVKYGVKQAVKNICPQIQKFDKTHDKGDKFNKTLTVASIHVVDHFIQKSSTSSFTDFIEEFPSLKTGFKNKLEQHYGFDILNSEEAKREYLEPDLLPFS